MNEQNTKSKETEEQLKEQLAKAKREDVKQSIEKKLNQIGKEVKK